MSRPHCLHLLASLVMTGSGDKGGTEIGCCIVLWTLSLMEKRSEKLHSKNYFSKPKSKQSINSSIIYLYNTRYSEYSYYYMQLKEQGQLEMAG